MHFHWYLAAAGAVGSVPCAWSVISSSSIPKAVYLVPALRVDVKIHERMAGNSGEVVGAEISVRELQEPDLYPTLIDDSCQESVTVICVAAVNVQMLSQISLLKKNKLISYNDV